MLDLIGVSEGGSCLDIGCGPGGITGLLSRRVGSQGRVVGLDMNAGFLEGRPSGDTHRLRLESASGTLTVKAFRRRCWRTAPFELPSQSLRTRTDRWSVDLLILSTIG
jgi:SAM-dependent methyltransferase